MSIRSRTLREMGGEATLSRRQKSSSQVEKGEVTLVGNLRSKPHDIDI